MNEMGLALAEHIIELAESKRIGVPMVISIVDAGGNLIALHRMDNALLASVDISINKAWTSVALKMSTDTLANLATPEGPLYGINTTNNGRIVVFGGGIPIIQNNKIIGGIGVSGGSVEQDIHVAEAALRYLPWDLRNS